MTKKNTAACFAILAAALYAINIPMSKLLLHNISPTMMAAFLYLGAGAGLLICTFISNLSGNGKKQEKLTKKEFPYTLGMILLDILAPILLMYGISYTDAANVSLLNNFEIAATSLVALVIFKEFLSKRLWFAIILVITASIILGFEGAGSFRFNTGSLFVLGACLCWGFENNCTRKLSNKSSVEITTVKGCFSGTGSFIIALVIGEPLPTAAFIIPALLLGFVSYGLSINFYIMAQKDLGAAKTSAFYSVAPFLGVLFSFVFLGERPAPQFYIAAVIMIAATVILIKDSVTLQHTHEHTHIHTHEHTHKNGTFHSHEHTHIHSHIHAHFADNEDCHLHTHADFENHNHIHK